MIKQIEPYLKHIGNCTATNFCTIDESCICGLRQVFYKLEVMFTKQQSVVRYVQRTDDLRDSQFLADENLYRARELAREL